MIIARVEGGLGNQFFIYAAARALALRKNKELFLDVSNAGYEGSDPFQRRYRLDQFPIAAQILDVEKTKHFRRDSRSFYWRRKLSRILPAGLKPIIEEKKFFTESILSKSVARRVYVVGYWQDERYFSDAVSHLSTELSPVRISQIVHAEEQQAVIAENSIVLHVRRNAFPFKLSASYYRNAIEGLSSHSFNDQFVVFGDSFDWVKTHLGLPKNTIYMDRNFADSDLQDFYLMSRARRLVIANSTFSWWAGWFARRNGARVVAPAEWGYSAKPSRSWEWVAADRYVFD
jgi:hypothetical protein